MAKLITASYPSRCFYGDRILPGQQIVWDAATRRARHVDCHSPVGESHPANLVEAVIAAAPKPTLFDEMVYDPGYAAALLSNARKPATERVVVQRPVSQQAVAWAAGIEIPNPRPEPEPRPEPVPDDRKVSDGIYTVELEGTHRTLRVVTYKDKSHRFFGKTIVSLLIGQDNESEHSYKGFAFLYGTEVKVWARFRNDADASLGVQAARVLADPEAAAAAGLAYAIESGRCYRCNHLLTVPASVNRGMGPECRKRMEG